MDFKLKAAKNLFKRGHYLECKQLLLGIINKTKNSSNYKLLSKVGDISIELHEYEDAKQYYEQSIKINPTNASIYLKLGNLFHEHLNNNKDAERMYETCIDIDPQNEECWFNFGKLMYKIGEYIRSINCYNKCQTERACINYHYALSLLAQTPLKDTQQQQALHLLEKATQLQPNIIKYFHKYALCLQNSKLYNKANNAFKKALELSNYKDINILNDHSLFVSKYLQKEGYDEKNNDNTHDSIKLIIYTFEQTITYWNTYDIINKNNCKLEQLRTLAITRQIFGGVDRKNTLSNHFNAMSSKNVKLAIISGNVSMTTTLLKRLYIDRYFNAIVNEYKNNLLRNIHELIIKYNLNSQNVLFVDHNLSNINTASKYCQTYYVNSNYIINGLSIKHILEIEQLLNGNQLNVEYNSIKCKTLKNIDEHIYIAIKKEIGAMHYKKDPIDNLSVIQWIYENWKDENHINMFVEFADKYKQIRESRINLRFWTIINNFPAFFLTDLNGMQSIDERELLCLYAKSLSELGHFQQAETYFQRLLQQSNHFLNVFNYAYHLVKMEKFDKAVQYFRKLEMNTNCMERNAFRIYRGLAYCHNKMKLFETAEIYFKLGVDYANDRDAKCIHFEYGVFLFERCRYKEAENELKYADEMRKNKRSKTCFYLSQTLLKLKKYKEYEYYLNWTLRLEPDWIDVQNEWSKYYKKPYNNLRDDFENVSE